MSFFSPGKLNNVLDDLAKKYNVTPATIATAWILRHPAHIKHLIETAEAANIKLTRQEWYDLYLASGKPLP